VGESHEAAQSREMLALRMDERERAHWVAFNRAPGIGAVRVRRLLERFGSLAEAWAQTRMTLSHAGLDRRVLDALTPLQKSINPERELERARAIGVSVLTWLDPEYPPLLRAIPDPPPVIYLKGQLAPEDGEAVSMVGTRRATVYGREVAERLARELSDAGLTVVSGLAKGIDSHVHTGALAGTGRTIAVLGHGLDTLYPPEHRRLAAAIVERGALVSDYPIGMGPIAENFPPRNRIISGLTAGVVVVEADHGSGALITAKYAQDQGRDVLAVPGPITSPGSRGCNRLIQDGATLVTSAADVLEALNPHLTAAAMQQLQLDFGGGPFPRHAVSASESGTKSAAGSLTPGIPPEVRAEDPLVATLRAAGKPVHVDVLSRTIGKPINEVTGTLVLLEVQGLVRHAGGMRYELTFKR
jgi:DNA processing protein